MTARHRDTTSRTISRCALFALFSVAMSSAVHAQQGGHWLTLPSDHEPGYRPTLRYCVELDEVSGNFVAYNANEARFNRIWMDQHQAKTGSAAQKELLKLGAKALYRMIHRHMSLSYLPDEEGRVQLAQQRQSVDIDYRVHLRSSSLALGFELNF